MARKLIEASIVGAAWGGGFGFALGLISEWWIERFDSSGWIPSFGLWILIGPVAGLVGGLVVGLIVAARGCGRPGASLIGGTTAAVIAAPCIATGYMGTFVLAIWSGVITGMVVANRTTRVDAAKRS